MSQAGLLDIENSNPQIPTSFVTDSGTAVPIFNILEILGINGITTSGSGNTVTIDGSGISSGVESIGVDASTPPGTDPVLPLAGVINFTGAQVANGIVGTNVVRTNSVAANEVTIEIQRSAASPVTNAALNGVAHFDSTGFVVDANGYVTLLNSGSAIEEINLQSGTSPVTPLLGVLTFNGAVVPAGTNPVRTDGTAAHTMALEVQISQAIAATDATKIGLANFDSAAFDVDANGFVQLNGGGIAATSFDVQANTAPGTDPVVPSATGQVTVNGAAVANHSVVLETRSRAANAYNLEIQYATTSVATDATKSGVAHFNEAQFSVDANGFVTVNNEGFAWNDVSGAFSPLKNNGYFVTATATGTLPAAPAQGDTIKFFVDHASQLLTIQASGTQLIRFGTSVSSAGGTAVSTQQGDSVELVYRSSNTTWQAVCGFSGGWNLA